MSALEEPPTPPVRRRRRPTLTLSFGVLSLVMTAGLGAVLAVQLRSTIDRRSTGELRRATMGGIALTTNMITASDVRSPGAPLTVAEEIAQVRLMTAASQALIGNGDSVGVEVALPNGSVIAGAGASPVGTKLTVSPEFTAAASGTPQAQTLKGSRPRDASAVEQNLVRQHGDLLLIQVGVRVAPGAPIAVVVRTYAPMRPSQEEAADDLGTILRLLVLGLIVFWAVLFRLVIGASRALTREAAANTYLVTHDALTRLPNRVLLTDRAQQAIVASRRDGRRIAVLVLHMDRLRHVNDRLGHRAGETLLQLIADRLRLALSEAGTVARIDAQEFVVMLADLASPADAVRVAEALIAGLDDGFEIDGALVDVGACFGVAVSPEDGDDLEQLVRHARLAASTAANDSLAVVLYTPLLEVDSEPRLAIVSELRLAIEHPEQIVLHYQPKVDLATGAVNSVEALVRWQHPTDGLLPPDAFIPIAESTGIIRGLTRCILRVALIQNRQWAEHGVVLGVAVNISARCLLDDTFPDQVRELLNETGVPVERLELEITETAMMGHPEHALAILRRLAADGVRLSIDDFGTGFATMTYLKHLPVREIKIDQTFVSGMADNESDAAIVRSSIELARTLHLDTVAEGVETADVLTQLTTLGCTSAQGYYLSKPLPPGELTQWLSAWPTATNNGIAGRRPSAPDGPVSLAVGGEN